jgi:predicted TIM-barrel fold metal-dependent hydrolase
MSPFWEDDLESVVEAMGAERVLFGSDWPHMEGLPEPRDILVETDRLESAVADRFLYANTNGLTGRNA